MGHIERNISFTYWVIFLFYMCVTVLFSVICHRLVLLNPLEVSSSPFLRFGSRELRFLYWIITLTLILFAIAILGVGLIYLASLATNVAPNKSPMLGAILLTAIPAIYLVSRLSIIFPAIATDMEFSLKWAWRLTANNGWRLTVIVGGLPVILALLLSFLARDQATLFETLVLSFVGSVLTAVEVVAVSLSYQQLIKASELNQP